MSKSYKCKNSNYLDSRGIVHNKKTLDSILEESNFSFKLLSASESVTYKNVNSAVIVALRNVANNLTSPQAGKIATVDSWHNIGILASKGSEDDKISITHDGTNLIITNNRTAAINVLVIFR